ncbi:FAD/FMN-dependent dehydrogenase, partial [Metarhizium majus ARSEF 297]
MHDMGAVIPAAVVSPRREWGGCQTVKLLQEFKLYDGFTISIKSGGHGYLHRDPSSHPVILLNLGAMTNQYISNGTLVLEPGCLLGQVMHTLATHHKAIPHGDCFGVGVGGHFTTAGWDLMLTRRYGLGCQSVIGGRVVLWDGSVVSVDEHSHPDLLYALRGGAAAGAGVATEIRLRLIDEPKVTTRCNIRLNREQVAVCVTSSLMDKTQNLPLDISPSFKFYYKLDDTEPICAFALRAS